MASIALPPFLAKLQKLTKDCDASIGGWNAEGDTFEIYNERFEKEVLKRHFKGNKATFIRQLHFYCFKKSDSKGSNWSFSHPKFLRDQPYLIYEIKRKTRTENAGPASKDEVQALRTELVSMKSDMEELRETVRMLQNQLMHNNGMQQQQPMPGYAAEVAFQKKVEMFNHNNGASPKKRQRIESDDDSASFSGLLPFEDGANVSAFYREHNINVGDDSPVSSPRYDNDLKKQVQPFGSDFMDLEHGMDDFSDFFFGMEESTSTTSVYSSSSSSSSSSTSAATKKSGSSSSSSSSSKKNKAAEQRLPETETNVKPTCCAGGLAGDELLNVDAKPIDQQDLQVFMGADRRDVNMPTNIFAGFLSKFVEHAILLHSKNMLAGDTDAELEIFVQSSLPEDCPLKDLLTYAPAHVRTVLVNVLSDVASSYWQCSENTSALLDSNENRGDFMSRPFLTFVLGDIKKEIKGQCFLQFLNFLLRAAVTDKPSAPALEAPTSPILNSLDPFFSPQVKRVLNVAHNRIEEYKKRINYAANTCNV